MARILAAVTIVLTLLAAPLAAQHHSMPSGQAMGFDQDAAVHHFTLTSSGGTIAVAARDAGDVTNVTTIRTHLRGIAVAFSQGKFDAPFATHGEIPPGVPTLQRLKSAVSYSYTETAAGGRVDISTTNAKALEAVHAFLRYQIREHRTGDSETIRTGRT